MRNEGLLHECLADGGVALQSLKLVYDCSLVSLEQIPVDFLFAEIYFSVKEYSIFGFEPMNNLSLGVSRLLKEYP